jgi:hypothetical protein
MVERSLLAALLLGMTGLASGQSPPTTPLAEAGSETAPGVTNPLSSLAEMSQPLMRDKSLAPLDRPAAASGDGGNGTNPADTARRFVLRNEYLELGGGVVVNTSIARFSFPAFEKRGAVSFELPFNYIDTRLPNLGQVGGLGDFKLGLSYNLFTSESKQLTILGGADFWVPSADNVLLGRRADTNTFTFQDIGTGKFRAGPFAGMVYAFDPTLIVAPIYQHEFSFAGDGTRADINRGIVRLFAMKAFESGFYLLPEAQLLIDYRNGGDIDAFLAPEVGFSRKGTTIFAKPGFGINPDANNRYYGINFGIRQDF